jgi:hypothetical protein
MVAGDGFSWIEVEVPDPAGSGYKFRSGATWIADPNARSYEYDAFGEISFVRPPADAPRLDRYVGVADGALAPRELRVYVPPGAGPWPVLYAHDGQNLFDPGAIWGGWRLDDAIVEVGGGVLVVGIDNTWDRLDEYTHVPDDIGYVVGGRADEHVALVVDVIRPAIERVYGSTGRDGLLGSSLGGLVSLMSGTLGWGRFAADGPVMEELWLDGGVRGPVVYVDSGGGDGGDGCSDPDRDGFPEDDPNSDDNYCENRQFADALAAAGYTWSVDLFHWHEPGAEHDELAWASRVALPLSLFLDGS